LLAAMQLVFLREKEIKEKRAQERGRRRKRGGGGGGRGGGMRLCCVSFSLFVISRSLSLHSPSLAHTHTLAGIRPARQSKTANSG